MTQPRILIVDQDQAHTARLGRELEENGCVVTSVASAAAFWAVVMEARPDAILASDLVKHLTPLDIIEYTQEHDLDSYLIVLNENNDLDEGMRWIVAGAFACYPKPVGWDRLSTALARGQENKLAFHEVLNLTADLARANEELEQSNIEVMMERQRLTERTKQLKFLNALGADLGKTLISEEIAGLVLSSMARLMGPSLNVAVTTFGPGHQLRLYADAAVGEEHLNGLQGHLKGVLAARYSQNGYRFNLVETDPDRPFPAIDLENSTSGPLVAAGARRGVLVSYPVVGHKPPADIKMVFSSLSQLAAQSFYNAHQHEKALFLASNDALTGLYNRRTFEETLAREFKAAQRYGQPLCLIMLDLDHFKIVNDTLGHQAGDEFLRLTAQAIERSVRETDIIARFGGEEFAVLLPKTSQEQALVLARRIEKNLARVDFPTVTATHRQTISQGLADSQDPRVRTPGDLVWLADQALYLAKGLGRDRICAASELTAARAIQEVRHGAN